VLSSSRAGSVDILLAASLWGTTGTVRTFAAVGPIEGGAAKTVLGGLLLTVLAARGGRLRTLLTAGRTTWALLAVGAVCVADFQLAFFAAVVRTGVATGTVVTIGSAPVLAGLLAGARPSRRWTVSTAAAVTGCALLVGGGRGAGVEPLGVGLALLSGLGYAAYATIAGRLIGAGADDRAVIGALFGGAGLVLVPALALGSLGPMATVSGALVTLYLGVITTAVPYVLYARGLRTTPVPVATTLGLAEPAVAAVLGLTVLGEHLAPIALAGIALLGAALFLLIRP
jgi:DME family drug/metabolite transporter